MAALRELGFDEEDLADEAVLPYPDNAETALLFEALGTQWRAGMGGATGLDYGAIRPTARLLGIRVDRERFLELRAMEHAALNAMAEARENAAARRR